MNRFYLVLIILVCFYAGDALAQRSNGLTLEGTVTVEQGNVDGAEIEIHRNGRRINNFGIGSNGRYKLELDYNNEYTLIFLRNNNFPQKIVVDTRVPQSVLQSDPLFPSFPLDIKLFTEIKGIDKTFSENTVMKIYYSERVDNFISDLFYNDSQIKQLIDQAIVQSQQIGKEADLLAGFSKTELAELKKEYDRHIRQAETEYNREEFLNALDGYKAANKIFPAEQYPKDRIAEINDLLGLLMVAEEMDQALKARLQVLLAQADTQFDQKNYEEARASYQRALSVDSGNNHAQTKLAEINEIVNKVQIDKEYNALIAVADNSFDELLYAEARNLYSKALELKSNEPYPQQKIDEVDQILKQQTANAEKLKGYRESIFQAELNFEKQFYDKAISYYENALNHKPGDEVASKKIDEIRELMSHLANKTMYDKRIKTADRAYQRKQYEDALAEYEEAARLMPLEKHAQTRIEQINAIFDERDQLAAAAEAEKARLAEEAAIAEQARLDALAAEQERAYNQALARADSLFRLENYEGSVAAYQMAQQVKPEEPLPGQRIDDINVLLGQLAKAQQVYDAAVARGDAALNEESFEASKVAYTEAQQAKPDETHPGEMLARIDSIIESRAQLAAEAEAEKVRLAAEAKAAEQARLAALAAEKELQYNVAISRADSLFKIKEYKESQIAYLSAQQVKPEETLPAQRIDEIDKLLGQLAAAQQLYYAAVARADEAFGQESFEVAKTSYMEAQQAIPGETHPGEMLARIDSIIESRALLAAEAEAEKARLAAEAEAAEMARLAALAAEKELQYNVIISRADSLFELKEYKESQIAYLSAQQIRPEEALPGQRIDEINGLIGQLAAAQQAYDSAVARANEAFGQESFEVAKTSYMEARKARPEETYPGEMLARIDSIIESRALLAAEAEAEKARLAAAEEAAEQARLAAQAAEKDSEYNQAVSLADSLFNSKEYDVSRKAYLTAQQVKPEEVLPGQRIDEIDGLMNRLAVAQQAYDAAIARADDAFGQESFEVAKAAFMEAQQAIPEQTYPGEMLARIDSIAEARAQLAAEAEAERVRLAAEAEAAEQSRLAALAAEKEMQYNQAISRADSLFALNEFENSLTSYTQALATNGNSIYPQQRIGEIEKILADLDAEQKQQEKIEQDYRNAIQLANQQFESKDFDQAKDNYQQALAIKPGESYPVQRIAEADKLLRQLEQDEQYHRIILVADELFQNEAWSEAKSEYQNASAVRPDESHPRNQIMKIDNLLNQQEEKLLADQQAAAATERRREEAEQQQQVARDRQEMNDAGLNQLYQEYISLADGFFDSRNYNVSRAWYYKASDIRQNEIYPQKRIEEINSIVSGMLRSQRDRDYQSFVNLADSTFRENQLAVSRGWYNRALSVKPDESYPKEQLEAIAVLIAERLAGRSGEQFNSNMRQASEAIENRNYNVARYWLKKALELRPDDTDAKEKLKEIESLLK